MSTAVIIEDSPIMRRRLSAILLEIGYETVGEGASGEELFGLYAAHRPTVVIIDIVLPGRDGVAIASDLLRRHPEALVIMCSSLTSREKIVACQKAGVAYYLLKPFDPEKLKAVVKFIVATKGAARAS
ncbi:MAG TPA: response regulator [Polyangia bacterium]|jgi:two-component system chemotaxis response regulator CheY|nr:response regulator [Polyangia bacterium]